MSTQTFDFAHLVAAIQQTHVVLANQAAKAVNISLTLRNWFIGQHIAEFELQGADRARYGDKLLSELAQALREQAVSNVGKRQLYGYLAFYRAYPQIVRTASALSAQTLLPNAAVNKVRTASAPSPALPAIDPDTLITRLSYSHFEQLVELDDPMQRAFYEVEALRGNWSVRELKRQIATQYYQRTGLSTDKAAVAALAHAKAEQATSQHIIRDPYVFEFLGFKPQEAVTEGQLEDALLDKLQAFLLELGKGFAFLGRQYPLSVNGKDYFLDLLFYHARLKCYVVIELKAGEFKPEYIGKLNFYLSAVDDQLRADDDQPTIGLILCKDKNKLDVEYALRDIHKPMGVSSFITKDIPLSVQSQLPTVQEIESELTQGYEEDQANG